MQGRSEEKWFTVSNRLNSLNNRVSIAAFPMAHGSHWKCKWATCAFHNSHPCRRSQPRSQLAYGWKMLKNVTALSVSHWICRKWGGTANCWILAAPSWQMTSLFWKGNLMTKRIYNYGQDGGCCPAKWILTAQGQFFFMLVCRWNGNLADETCFQNKKLKPKSDMNSQENLESKIL